MLLNGYPPQTGFSSGGYYQGFVVAPGDSYVPDKPAPGRRVVFLVEPDWVPAVAEALAGPARAPSSQPVPCPTRRASCACR